MYFRSFAGIALVLPVLVGHQEALAQARARAHAGDGAVGLWLHVIEPRDLVVPQGQHAIALRHEVVDQLHLL